MQDFVADALLAVQDGEITDGKTTTELEFPGEPDERFFVDGLPAPKNITHFRGGSTWFSNWGTCVDIFAPGGGITGSAVPVGPPGPAASRRS